MEYEDMNTACGVGKPIHIAPWYYDLRSEVALGLYLGSINELRIRELDIAVNYWTHLNSNSK